VVGQEEVTASTVNVRTRDNVVHGERTVEALLAEFRELVANKKYEPPVSNAAKPPGKKGGKREKKEENQNEGSSKDKQELSDSGK